MLELFRGDCLEQLEWMPSNKVQCCVTSPPYFGLRDYGHDRQIGLEETPEQYVQKMVEVFREVRRVLKPDGTLWLNLGDSYAGAGPSGASYQSETTKKRAEMNTDGAFRISKTLAARGLTYADKKPVAPPGYKKKDLLGIPWMVAFALRADGWYLRQDIIWRKPNPMPESVTDRCTKAHEYIFLMSKSPKYYFDHEAIKEPAVGQNEHDLTGPGYKAPGQSAQTGSRSKRDSFKRIGSKRAQVIPGQSVGTHREDREESTYDTTTRNRRSVWEVATRPYKGAHFATYPPDLVKPCILAGSRPGDIVLDPFGGSGTTAEVAIGLGRFAWLCELNPDYVPLIKARAERGMEVLGL